MNRKTKAILILIVWLPAVLIALAMHYWLHLNLWLALALVALAGIANGFLAEWEDRKPGGFLNPKQGKDKKSNEPQ